MNLRFVRSLRFVSSLAFAGAASGLALPFVKIGEGNPTGSLAILWQGTDFVVGGHFVAEVSALLPDGDGRYSIQRLPQESIDQLVHPAAYPVFARPAFIVAAVLLLAGLLAPLLAGVRPPRALAASAAFGAIIAFGIGEAIVLVGALVPSPAAHPGPAYGFWVVLGLLGAIGTVNLYALRRPPRPDSVEPDVLPEAFTTSESP